MKTRILFILKYFVFWLLLFVLQKFLFMAFNWAESSQLNAGEWLSVIWHGLRLDMSAATYLLLIPIVGLSLLSFFEIRFTKAFLRIYNYIFLFIVLYLGIVDMELYSYWGFKLDITPLVYLKTPGEAVASLNLTEIAFLFILLLALYFGGIILFRKYVLSEINKPTEKSKLFGLVGVFILAFSIIPLRGGIGIAPINLGSVYFHNNRFANQSAVNVFWNAGYSWVEKESKSLSIKFMEDEKATELFKIFYPQESAHKQVIKKDANVILIILESFSNKIIGELGGEKSITPCIDSMCKDALIFRNFYASGDRSEKGMLSIFSGYPSIPTISVINYPSKSQNLPFLFEPYHEKGYYTAFYYGGDLNFANFRSYFTHPGMDQLVTMNDFPSEQNMQKWGVPDEFLFDKMSTDIDTIKQPFFVSCFSLSSHEPYDMPFDPVFETNNNDGKSKNGFYYTDKCLGEFIDRAKSSDWWDNTLIVIIADHGSRFPGNTPNHLPVKFNIPMIWTGGAVNTPDSTVYTYCSQTDIPQTLLNQFDLPSNGYKFSKDILNEASNSFAMYFFNNGYGYLSDSVKLIYDINISDYIMIEGGKAEEMKDPSKAYLQQLSKDFNNL
ncbi:MAG: sulfatase-like hydrolase/transferase [Bacteroidales bacterium]|nr:sulfatase-like hydrolase/transferase [Bacteroidales bacterium]MCF8391868.1 sulfatase-like hydrolase/transferase [Bacteroidales bacterium]